MEWLTVFAALLLIHGAAAVSPGPNFLIVLRNALRFGSSVGVITSLGVVSAGSVFVTARAVGVIGHGALSRTILRISR